MMYPLVSRRGSTLESVTVVVGAVALDTHAKRENAERTTSIFLRGRARGVKFVIAACRR